MGSSTASALGEDTEVPSLQKKAGEEHRGVPPRPYLTRADTNERLRILGFDFNRQMMLEDSPVGRERLQAVEDLIAGAIAEWVGVEMDEEGKDDFGGDVAAELQEWAEEYLVG